MTATKEQFDAAVDGILNMNSEQLRKLFPVLNNALAVQRRLDSSRTLASLEVTDRVVIGNVKPKYLQGIIAEVMEIDSSGRVLVKLPRPMGKFHDGMVRFRSASCVKKVN